MINVYYNAMYHVFFEMKYAILYELTKHHRSIKNNNFM